MRFTLSCNSCICDVSLCIVSWLSLDSCLENSSIRISWALFNSSTSWILLIWVSRRALSRCANSSLNLACSLRDVSYPRLVWSISLRLEWICPLKFTNRTVEKICSAFLLQYFRSCLCDLVSFSESESLDKASFSPWTARCLCWSVIIDWTFFCARTQLQVSPHLLGNEMNLTQSFLCRSDRLVIGLHLLLSPVSKVVKPACSVFAHRPNPIQVTSVLFISVRSLGS